MVLLVWQVSLLAPLPAAELPGATVEHHLETVGNTSRRVMPAEEAKRDAKQAPQLQKAFEVVESCHFAHFFPTAVNSSCGCEAEDVVSNSEKTESLAEFRSHICRIGLQERHSDRQHQCGSIRRRHWLENLQEPGSSFKSFRQIRGVASPPQRLARCLQPSDRKLHLLVADASRGGAAALCDITMGWFKAGAAGTVEPAGGTFLISHSSSDPTASSPDSGGRGSAHS